MYFNSYVIYLLDRRKTVWDSSFIWR